MLYTSSIGLAHSWPAQKGAVPESVLPDLTLSIDSGYSASKFVVEQVRSSPLFVLKEGLMAGVLSRC